MVFDKVRENARGVAASGRMTYSDTVNLSMNQVLMRSLNTSLVAILPILSILIIGAGVMGATVLKDFGLALLVGLLTGAYSSIFIASPLLAILKEREPRYVNVRQRLAAKGGSSTHAHAGGRRRPRRCRRRRFGWGRQGQGQGRRRGVDRRAGQGRRAGAAKAGAAKGGDGQGRRPRPLEGRHADRPRVRSAPSRARRTSPDRPTAPGARRTETPEEGQEALATRRRTQLGPQNGASPAECHRFGPGARRTQLGHRTAPCPAACHRFAGLGRLLRRAVTVCPP